MEEKKYYATGKRKSAIARVNLTEGKSDFTINGKKLDVYFEQEVLKMVMNLPFKLTETEGKFGIRVIVTGGGPNGQAGAIKHGISKALLVYNPELRPILKKNGFITRDARVKERKKYGQKGARARFQFSKR
ncbi:MAG: 30S ribosomal protein S9 [Pseudomonadota bacterium]